MVSLLGFDCIRGNWHPVECSHLPQCNQRLAMKKPPLRNPITINRAPVLTLWAAVVAARLGFDEDEALTLGKAVAGLNAQAKGRRLGIFKPHEEKPHKARKRERGEEFWIEVFGRPVPAINTDEGIRAVKGAEPIDPDGVRRYLQSKFGDDLDLWVVAEKKRRKVFL
jgi:hypothetical protein